MQPKHPMQSRIVALLWLVSLMMGAGAATALPALYDPAGGFLDTNLGGLPGFSGGSACRTTHENFLPFAALLPLFFMGASGPPTKGFM